MTRALYSRVSAICLFVLTATPPLAASSTSAAPTADAAAVGGSWCRQGTPVPTSRAPSQAFTTQQAPKPAAGTVVGPLLSFFVLSVNRSPLLL